ncbi:MAG: DUF4082 domain-containing protein, partial [Acidobacteriota bacterium]
GTNFVSGATVAVSGTGVTVSGVTVVSATQITANFVIGASATTGARNVTVTTTGGTTGAVTFTVSAPAAPTLTAISPTSGTQGATVPVTLTGTNFVSGATVAVSGTGVTVSGVTVVSATQITASFVIGASAATGAHSVTVTTTGGTTGAVTFTVNTSGTSGGAISIWNSSTTPTIVDSDTAAVELGLKFRSDVAGTVTGVRFYKASANTGTHTGHLWSASGTLLASVTFSGETASGWQQASFSTPVAINANTTYVISYFAPRGRYSVTENYFASTGADNAPLHALRSGVDGQNGVYRYGSSSGFPSSSFNSSNYWVDVVFVPSSAPLAGSLSLQEGARETLPPATGGAL